MWVFVRGHVTQPGLCCSPRPLVEQWKSWENVGLVDGSIPTLGNSKSSITGLEPAVWFKVLVVDRICIDFVSNTIQWTTCREVSCAKTTMGDVGYQRCKHTHECLLNEDFYLPDVDLQRGVDLAKHILVRRTEDEDDVDLLHLLHVYILPIIRLHSEDKEHVTRALINQKEVLGHLDAKIDQMSSQRTMIKENMRHWREDICRQLQTENAIIACNTSFLKLLCQHLESDIRNSYVELDNCQKKVEEAKLRVKKKEGEHYVSQLSRARQVRDQVSERITQILYVVEEVGLMIRVSKTPDKQKLTNMHEAYIKIQENWEDHTKELTELQRKKVCATSVREALVCTEAELESGGDTTGVEMTSDGIKRPTDVLEDSSVPAGWETLQSQVSKSLELNPIIQQQHREFIRWMSRFCAKAIKSPHSSWKEKVPECTLQCTQVEASINATCLNISPDAFSNLRQSIRDKNPTTHFQGLTLTLKNEVFLHCEDIVDLLVKDSAVPSTCFARLWACYERCFFAGRTRDVLRLYERAYNMDIKKLQRILSTVTIRDLDLDDEWILNILGLFAPEFPTEKGSNEEMGEESGLETSEEQDDEVGEKTGKEGESNVLAAKKGVETKTRERLESGIGVEGAVRRLRVSGKRDALSRSSNRYTKIIDLTWVQGTHLEVDTLRQPQRASTWSGLDFEERLSQGEVKTEDTMSVPEVCPVFEIGEGCSQPINIPNKNGNARTLSIPSVSDSGVSLNISKDSDLGGAKGLSDQSPDSKDVIDRRCQDSPNIKVFMQRFHQAYSSFRIVLQDTVPMSKLQWLYRCLQEVNNTAEKQSRLIFCGKPRMLSGDDLLTTLILFLLHGDLKEISAGYYHLKLLEDYLPDFLDKGYFGFAVTQFLLAYNYILGHEEQDGCANK